ncbi:HalOD1 output domain-containing protein [Halorarum halobium]|uniref:HalOD1 output domain-containing protein n=1 Tax=Halorarum halobium TaxID=3075121 RepID=UPI0028AB3B12|nr:HalOD1 output domain-containing protein [Halobaculum sp. XH14]
MTESEDSDGDVPASDSCGAIQAEFDWSVVTPSTAVVETVAIAAACEPTVLEPLYETVDPDALDTLIRSIGTDSKDGDATVTFALDGYQVTVERDGRVDVRPHEARAESE